jgi:sugar (pentulose or hexulose) kinase
VSAEAQVERLTADEIFSRRLAPAPWPSSSPVLAIVVELLPTIEDDLTADLLEHVALALADRDDELRAVRAVLSSTLALSHDPPKRGGSTAPACCRSARWAATGEDG